MEIRSYRRVFDLERRIYSVDRLRLNPGGVPVRGVLYFAAIVAGGLIAVRVPLLDSMVGALPWYMRDLVLPGAGATVLGMIRVEGRTFHVATYALLRFQAGPRRLAGLRRCAAPGHRWLPGAILMLPDGSDSRMRRLRYSGPGAVLVSVEHELGGGLLERLLGGVAPWRSGRVTLRQLGRANQLSEGRVISLQPGARLQVRSRARDEDRR